MVDRKRNYKDRDNRVEWEERVVSVQRVTKVVKAVSYTHLTLPTTVIV